MRNIPSCFISLQIFSKNLFFPLLKPSLYTINQRLKVSKIQQAKEMTSFRVVEVEREDQTPNKWRVSLTEEVFKRLMMQGNPTVQKVFGDGSLFSPLLFGKYFDPSDAFPLWEFESDVLLSNLRTSGKTAVDWFQTNDAYVLKSDLPGVGINTIQVYVEKGKIVEISGQWKQQGETKAKEWRSGRWWEDGYVRRLELPADADCKKIHAYLYNDVFLELTVPKNTCDSVVDDNISKTSASM